MSQTRQPDSKTLVVLCGGQSSEAEVSLVSGRAVSAALEALGFRTRRIELVEDCVPPQLSARDTIVFPAMHGGYGEGGALQCDLDALGIAYAGSDAATSALCMDKVATKNRIGNGSGFHMPRSIAFTTEKPHPAAMLWAALGRNEEEGAASSSKAVTKSFSNSVPTGETSAAIDQSSSGKAVADASSTNREEALLASNRSASLKAVLKPRSGGSSVGLFLLDSPEELEAVLPTLPQGEWLLERRVIGREMTIGVLNGRAQAIVEIVPEGGVYDFTRKYRSGCTQFLFPAPLPAELAQQIATCAERACAACGCRDFARVDFILDEQGRAFFLEINTLPGLTPTSLLPKSASVCGLDFNALIEQMTLPALARAGWTRAEISG